MIISKNDKHIQRRRKIKALFYGYKNLIGNLLQYVKYCNSDFWASQDSFLHIIVANYHVIEKCICMPDFEPGHGIERVAVVVGDLFKYKELGFDTSHVQYQAALQAVDEYSRIHREASFNLGSKLQSEIDKLLSENKFERRNQTETTKDDFFSSINEGFDQFAKSRHSCRSYSDEPIPMETIKQVIDLTRTTPTACNRQPNKIYSVVNPELIKKITDIQKGGRGFAYHAAAIFIITSRVDVFASDEMNEVWKAGGMHAMNLLYALHSYKIGACPLIWKGLKKDNNTLRSLLSIPPNEVIIMLVSAGIPRDKFKYVTSIRNGEEEYGRIIQ